jgi:conjugative transfer signal peptidase TraF
MAAAALAAVAGTSAAATLLWPPRPVLVWNASASSPLGLYRVAPAEQIRPGDMVVAWAPGWVRALADERHYLPRDVPVVKRVAAAASDRVCAAGEAVFVNGRFAARRRSVDAAGRPLPWWTGCEDLRGDELFLLMPGSPDSFDGRYFGPSERQEIIGEARLLWAR